MDQGMEMAEPKMYRSPEPGGDGAKQSEIPAAGDRIGNNIDRLGQTIAVLYERLDAGGVLSSNIPLSEAVAERGADPGAAPMAMRLDAFAVSIGSFRDSLDSIIRRLEV